MLGDIPLMDSSNPAKHVYALAFPSTQLPPTLPQTKLLLPPADFSGLASVGLPRRLLLKTTPRWLPLAHTGDLLSPGQLRSTFV